MWVRSKAVGKICLPSIGIFNALDFDDSVEVPDRMALHKEFTELCRKGLLEIVSNKHANDKKTKAETHIHQTIKVNVAEEVEKGVTQALTKLFESGVIQLASQILPESKVTGNNLVIQEKEVKKPDAEKFVPSNEETYVPTIPDSSSVKANISVNEGSISSEDVDNASEKLKRMLRED